MPVSTPTRSVPPQSLLTPVNGAGPPQDYHSDSAESLSEVPPDRVSSLHSSFRNSFEVKQSGDTNNSDIQDSSLKRKKNSKRNKKKKKEDEEQSNLNTTMLFQLNSSAKQNPDGSLDYTNGFRQLPLTPITLKSQVTGVERLRSGAVPPLDLGPLRGSSESVSFQPLSSLRSSDTYRTSRLLGNLPEQRPYIDTEV